MDKSNTAAKPTIAVIDGKATTTTRAIAENFGKRHERVLNALENLQCSEEFTKHNFVLSEYVDSTGRKNKEYQVTRDGFSFLCMGFTGTKAAKWKEAYIEAFNRMEAALNPVAILPSRISTVADRKALNDAVRELPQVSQLTYRQAWVIVHQFLGVEKIEDATVEQVSTALQYVHTLRVHGFEASTLVKRIEAPAPVVAAKGQMLIDRQRLIGVMQDMQTMQANMGRLFKRLDLLGILQSDLREKDWAKYALSM